MGLYFIGFEQTLQQILDSREERVRYQKHLLSKYCNTIVSYKLNIPGPIKYNSLIKEVFDEGLKLFKSRLKEDLIEVKFEYVVYKNSGPELFAVINSSAFVIKEITTRIEETHALGRLYDYDVLDSKGRHIDRQELNIESRKCLICDENAFECGRSRKHTVKELTDKIHNMAFNYFNSNMENK
ncbi:MAG TPA: citrate lyase holo-[acyl-carrier protein] synthase [Clostridium sp.]|uniref:citrate lyase holo-[acyl-carrier protein] synthase n=1 Tax=Clostridium sp. TaxID=1506 RepID=UPI002F922BF2